MKSRVFTLILGLFLVAVVQAAANPVLAFAEYDISQFYQRMDQENLKADAYRAMAEKIESVINTLPEDAGLGERKEIEAARATLNDALPQVSSLVSIESKKKLEKAEKRIENPSIGALLGFDNVKVDKQAYAILCLVLICYAIYIVQLLLSYETAYRKTKERGDTGVSLFGWLVVYGFAAFVPFLGIYLWCRERSVVDSNVD